MIYSKTDPTRPDVNLDNEQAQNGKYPGSNIT